MESNGTFFEVTTQIGTEVSHDNITNLKKDNAYAL